MNNNSGQARIGGADAFRVLRPYIAKKFTEQVKGVWFIVFYLFVFQLLVLDLPIVFALMIAVGLILVVSGLMFFMEGLRLGLMPLGEIIGSQLPVKAPMAVILLIALLLGIGATFAEPAIAVLKAAGSGVTPDKAPLLYSLLNDFSGALVLCVGVGVGFAVVLGILRFFYQWSLKVLVIPFIVVLSALTWWMNGNEILQPVLGLAWDCGAVTTGPVTVPLVLALGIGVCRIVGNGDSAESGFGIVTLASLFPILAVMLLSIYHYNAEDYYAAPNYQGEVIEKKGEAPDWVRSLTASEQSSTIKGYTEQELKHYLDTQALPPDSMVTYRAGETKLENGRIVLSEPQVIISRDRSTSVIEGTEQWDEESDIASEVITATVAALQAILPLCLFLYLVLRFVLREKASQAKDLSTGIAMAVIGMALFSLGITLGLTPLGSQVGHNVSSTFAEIVPWGHGTLQGPTFGTGTAGKLVAIAFAFFLGYGATLAEPALNALGETVERITVGAFKKKLLMQTVALGVGIGIATGITKMVYDIPLSTLLIPSYLFLIFLTIISSEEFVNFGWDSAGVTTGPITVPLVLAMGLGIGGVVPNVLDGFGVLALASVGPILTVLAVGLIVRYISSKE